jgi:hypothetical protein
LAQKLFSDFQISEKYGLTTSQKKSGGGEGIALVYCNSI